MKASFTFYHLTNELVLQPNNTLPKSMSVSPYLISRNCTKSLLPYYNIHNYTHETPYILNHVSMSVVSKSNPLRLTLYYHT